MRKVSAEKTIQHWKGLGADDEILKAGVKRSEGSRKEREFRGGPMKGTQEREVCKVM